VVPRREPDLLPVVVVLVVGMRAERLLVLAMPMVEVPALVVLVRRKLAQVMALAALTPSDDPLPPAQTVCGAH